MQNNRYKTFPTQTQVIHFVGGIKRTIHGVIAVSENEMTHILTLNGIEWIINKSNVLCVEIIKSKDKLKQKQNDLEQNKKTMETN